MINCQIRKYKKGIMVTKGISYYDLSDLMLTRGTMSGFQYIQALFNYKDNVQKLNLDVNMI